MMVSNAQNCAVKTELGRRYRFAASHRLHNANLSDAENWRLYGKCNNPYGHGHNYVLEVLVSGSLDPATGMIANLADLDGFVEREVLVPVIADVVKELDLPARRVTIEPVPGLLD